ncbi:hypothetical protein F5Y15DRAFT_424400 [Xylariaceae sp. FL0016]|nr:hypothetical protein F5Y15DRAFT_424400 [Xylariaceae sp. FL0016]
MQNGPTQTSEPAGAALSPPVVRMRFCSPEEARLECYHRRAKRQITLNDTMPCHPRTPGSATSTCPAWPPTTGSGGGLPKLVDRPWARSPGSDAQLITELMPAHSAASWEMQNDEMIDRLAYLSFRLADVRDSQREIHEALKKHADCLETLENDVIQKNADRHLRKWRNQRQTRLFADIRFNADLFAELGNKIVFLTTMYIAIKTCWQLGSMLGIDWIGIGRGATWLLHAEQTMKADTSMKDQKPREL